MVTPVLLRSFFIARTELLRLLRERSNLFFVFVFPLLLVAMLGAQFGGSFDVRIGTVVPEGDPDAADLVAVIDGAEGISTTSYEDAEALRDEVERGLVSGGVIIPDGYGEALGDANPFVIEFVGRSDATGQSLQTVVASAVAQEAAPGQAAAIAAQHVDATPRELREVAVALQDRVAGVEVASEELGVDALAQEFAGLGQFDLGASSQLFLFTWLTSLTGGVALIQSRQLGVARRMLSTSTPMGAIVLGFGGGRFLVAAMQAVYIVVASVLMFRVDWGDPLATGAILLAFCLVAAAGGLLLGATFRNDSQAGGAAIGLGLGMAALGGSMVPLEIFPEGMRTVARITPHAWANEAMAQIVRRDGSIVDVLPQLGALAAMAVAVLVLAVWQLRRALTR